MKAYESFDAYLADQSPKNRTIIGALRKFVKRVAPKLEESVKWGNGCWVDGKAPVSYVYSAPDYVQFGFFRGASLEDPRRLLEGNGQYVRHIKVRAASDIEPAAFSALLRQASQSGTSQPRTARSRTTRSRATQSRATQSRSKRSSSK
jgi:hypothetical protein